MSKPTRTAKRANYFMYHYEEQIDGKTESMDYRMDATTLDDDGDVSIGMYSGSLISVPVPVLRLMMEDLDRLEGEGK